jgi:hypothetical protein
MIKKIKRLLRVKELKEEEALRLVQARRRELAEAEKALLEAIDVRDQSAKTYDARETRIYDQIMGLVIGQLKIDDTKAQVLALAKQHQELVDDVTRMEHVVDGRKAELAKAVENHASCVKIRDKYVFLKDKMVSEALAESEAKEESEIEELFSKGIQSPDRAQDNGRQHHAN